jgi:hypothetical protein
MTLDRNFSNPHPPRQACAYTDTAAELAELLRTGTLGARLIRAATAGAAARDRRADEPQGGPRAGGSRPS